MLTTLPAPTFVAFAWAIEPDEELEAPRALGPTPIHQNLDSQSPLTELLSDPYKTSIKPSWGIFYYFRLLLLPY